MNHLEITAEFGVLIFQGFIAVGTGRNNLFNFVALKTSIFCSAIIWNWEFITGPSRRVAAAGLGIAQYREINARCFKHFSPSAKSRFDIFLVPPAPPVQPAQKMVSALSRPPALSPRFVRPVSPQPH